MNKTFRWVPLALFLLRVGTMKTYHCLIIEFYDDSSVKAAVISWAYKEKPKDSFKDTPIADCYKDWYDSESAAKQALAQYKM